MAYQKKKKTKRAIASGNVYIKATFNNTLVTITDTEGNVIATGSTGAVGYKGAKKGTPFAAQQAGEKAARKAVEVVGMERVNVFVKGPGSGRETAIRALQSSGLDVVSIRDITPVPHNGCRPPKRRRV